MSEIHLALPEPKFVVRVIGDHSVRFVRLKNSKWAAIVTEREKETVFKSFDEAQDRAREVLPWRQFKIVLKEGLLVREQDSNTKNGGKKNEQKK